MYKFAILLISCILAANNPVQGASTPDEELELIFKEYQNCLKIGDEDLDLEQFFMFFNNDDKSREALFVYFIEENVEIADRVNINVNRFKTYLEVVSKPHDKAVTIFANECFEKIKHQ